MTDQVKAYKLQHQANPGKLNRLQSVLFAYRHLAKKWSDIQWMRYYQTGRFTKDAAPISTDLPARMVQNCRDQVIGMLESFVANRENDIKLTILCSSLDKDTKSVLFRINRGNQKYITDHPDHYRLYLKIRKAIFARHEKPGFRRINMNLAHGMKLEPSKSGVFDYWVRVMTPERGRLINIPVKSNGYYESAKGRRNNAVQLNFVNNTLSNIVFTKTSPLTPEARSSKVVGIDTGLSCLFATSEGDMIGRRWIDDLSRYDKSISFLAARLQKQDIKPRASKRYCRLVSKLKAMIKNEVNRCLNRIVAIHNPSIMVWEKLDFRNPNMSRRLNRLIQNFGKGIIEKKKMELEAKGIRQAHVCSAYTSQECHKCAYVAKNNRATQSQFKCKSCNTTANADVKSGKTILKRFQSKPLSQDYLRKTEVLEILVKQYLERFKNSMNSDRVALLGSNPYFLTYSATVTGLT